MLRSPLRRSASARRHPCSPASLRPRRLNRGRPPPEKAHGPTRASPGKEGPRPPLRRSESWRRPCRLARLRPPRFNLGRNLPDRAPGPTRASPGGEGPRPLLSRSASAWQRLRRLAAPSSARGDRHLAGPHASGFPARPGLRPVERGCALPCVARPLPGDPLAAWRAFERAG